MKASVNARSGRLDADVGGTVGWCLHDDVYVSASTQDRGSWVSAPSVIRDSHRSSRAESRRRWLGSLRGSTPRPGYFSCSTLGAPTPPPCLATSKRPF